MQALGKTGDVFGAPVDVMLVLALEYSDLALCQTTSSQLVQIARIIVLKAIGRHIILAI